MHMLLNTKHIPAIYDYYGRAQIYKPIEATQSCRSSIRFPTRLVVGFRGWAPPIVDLCVCELIQSILIHQRKSTLLTEYTLKRRAVVGLLHVGLRWSPVPESHRQRACSELQGC